MSIEDRDSSTASSDVVVTKSFSLQRTDDDLFDDDKDVPAPFVQIRRVVKKNKESWQIFKNKELFLIVPGDKISKKQRIFLQTGDGISFLIRSLKNKDCSSVAKIKRLLREELG